jgi:enoyl-CoA hydratase/carnithine racemase
MVKLEQQRTALLRRAAVDIEDLVYEKQGHVATITLSRPERLNAISAAMLDSLVWALEDADADNEIRVIVITGTGKAFCAGGDLRSMYEGGDRAAGHSKLTKKLVGFGKLVPTTLANLDKPVIAKVNGPALGWGFDLALLCDLRVSTRTAFFGASSVKRGIISDNAGTWILPRLVGWGKAAEILLLGRILTAEQALDMGLINKVTEPEELDEEVLSWVNELSSNAPIAVQSNKRLMRLGLQESLEAHMDHLVYQLQALTKTEDAREGISAFFEKRSPTFEGH